MRESHACAARRIFLSLRLSLRKTPLSQPAPPDGLPPPVRPDVSAAARCSCLCLSLRRWTVCLSQRRPTPLSQSPVASDSADVASPSARRWCIYLSRRRLSVPPRRLLHLTSALLTSSLPAPATLCSATTSFCSSSGDLIPATYSGDRIPATWSVLLPLISMAASSSSTVNQTEIGGVRTENIPMQVINLRLTKENYFSWSPAMTMGIAARDRMTYIDGSNPEPARTSGVWRTWFLEDNQVKTWIVNSVSPEIQPLILRKKTARDMWVVLEQMYGQKKTDIRTYQMDSESIFPYDHILFGSCRGRSGLRIIPSGVYLPQWYLSWYPTFRCMFPDHLEDCGLEEAVSLAIQPINGNLIHAIAERWNPRTNTFLFQWGEMTITLDEFSNIMGLPEPKGDPRGPIEDQFLVNQGQVKALEVIRKLTGKRSWPFLEKDGHQYLQLQELGETYSQFVNPTSLFRSVADKYKNSMVTCTVGLIFFNNEDHIMDFRTARLFRKWGHVKSFIDLTERAECIEAGIENGAFDAVIPVKVREDTKKNSRSQNTPANIVANTAAFKKERSEYPKNKGVMDRASGSSSGTKNKHPGWGYDRKFTPLQQSYEEVMHMLIERDTLFLSKVSNPPPMMGKNKEQFCKFHRAPGHDTEDCLVLKNIVQDAVDKKIIKEVSEQPDILKNPFPKHGKGIISMVRFSTNHPMIMTNKRDTTSLDFFGLLFKHDKKSINAQTGPVEQDSLIEIDQKLQV
ncbi:hypothetical protein EJ110_NYTH30217 [Nymphaea thermarum]|nr:hypothetical protein EJ110_NYTH30217 [Nymphaea thermarum]